ncbi:MAG TPA: 1-acyl-sn-glycerol-3-phosphate acyltransferase [Usitatibacter sp.]|nr:1-acyl-sn-glycerol-3-phosphate acyltransferase [Usitatibacter sp.]
MTAMLRAVWGTFLMVLGAVLFLIICFLWAFVAVALSLILPARWGRKVGRHGAMWCFRIFLGTMEALGAWELDLGQLDALRHEGALVIAPNHPCLLDAVLVVSRVPDAVCVMKRSLLANFLLGPAARLARYVGNDSLLRLATSAEAELRDGGQLVLFPEATRSTAHPTGPFTDAVGAVARRARVPVQTVIIEADSRFLAKGSSLRDRPRFPLHYRVRLGRRFDAPTDVRAFTAELERYFARELASTSPSDDVGVEPAVSARHLRG